jgi:hypothetical protein
VLKKSKFVAIVRFGGAQRRVLAVGFYHAYAGRDIYPVLKVSIHFKVTINGADGVTTPSGDSYL